MIRTSNRIALAAAALTFVVSARDAGADSNPSRMAVEHLGASGAEVLAGVPAGGELGALVELPVDIDPTRFGMIAIAPGFAVMRGDAASIAGFAHVHPEATIELAPPLRPKLDLAVPYIAADPVRLPKTGGGVYDGSGTYVGIVDTGLDLFHPDFKGPDGKTRVAWLLDFSIPARDGNDLDKKYGGRVFTRAEVEAIATGPTTATGIPDDPEGHGTHVAGIAAGNGGPGKRFAGVAPGADLIIVRASRNDSGDIAETDAVAGTKFVFDMAKADGRAAVVNLSLGSQFGPHDGTSVFERALQALAQGPGRAVVVAASNEGDSPPIHTAIRVTRGTPVVLPLMLPGPDGAGATYRSAQVFVWISFRDGGDLTVALAGPDHVQWLSPVSKDDGRQVSPYAGVLAQVVNDVHDASQTIPSGTHGAIVTLRGPLPAGRYGLVLEGEGAIEAWIQGIGEAGEGDGSAFFSQGGLIEGTIGVPASSEGVISVGCVGLRTTLTSRLLKQYTLSHTQVGQRCFFSSAGPSANGAMRPDVMAPGFFVVSALAHRAFERSPGGDFSSQQIVEPTHAALSGTSMSSPFVAGAIALLFQRDPTLTQEGARDALQAGARALSDDDGSGFRDFSKGAGILDVEGAIAALDRKEHAPKATTMQLRLGGNYLASDGRMPMYGLVIARDAQGRPADVDGDPNITVDGAQLVSKSKHATTGLYRFALGTPTLGYGHATVFVTGNGLAPIERDVPIGADRWDAREGLAVGGGCGIDRQNSGDRAFVALAILGLVTRLRRSRSRSRAAETAGRRVATGASDRRG